MSTIKRKFIGRVRGSLWYVGSQITGNDTNGKVFPDSGVSYAYTNDHYLHLNPTGEDHGKVYECIKEGDANTAVWAYIRSLSFVPKGIAPVFHASTTTKYGAASRDLFGHVKIGNGLGINEGVLSWDETEATDVEMQTLIRSMVDGTVPGPDVDTTDDLTEATDKEMVDLVNSLA